MNCPKCNQQNPDNAKICSSCGSTLSYPPREQNKIAVKTSELAVTSCILGILSLPCFIVVLISAGRRSSPLSPYLPIISFAYLISGILAVLLGVIALVCIARNYGRLAGRAFAAIGVTMGVKFFSGAL